MQNNPPTPTTEPKQKSNAVSLIAIVLSLGALAGTGFLFTQRYLETQKSQHEQVQFDTELKSFRASVETQQKSAEESLNKINQRVELLTSGENKNRKAWVLVDAEYQLRLAQLQLTYQHNPEAAITLLTYVDDQIKSLNDPKILALRQAVANQLAAIRAVPILDLPGILSECSALSAQLKKLPLMNAQVPATQEKTTAPVVAENAKPWWRTALSTVGDELKNVVTVRRIDAPIKPMLSEASSALLSETLQYLLLQVQWAAIHGNTAVYHDSLQQTQTLIKAHYLQNAASTQAALATIAQLEKRELSPKLPDISDLITKVQVISQGTNAKGNGA